MVTFRGWLSWSGPASRGEVSRRLAVWTASPESPECWQTVLVHSHLTACQPTSHLDGTADKPATTQGHRRRGVLSLVQIDRSNKQEITQLRKPGKMAVCTRVAVRHVTVNRSVTRVA